ncbi:hypothetical protein IQ258_29155, partial [Coleofasciculus sp. LEGE 07081]
MTITVPHFDPLLKTPTGIEEPIKNSLAEYLFPDTQFAVGYIYEGSTTEEDLLEVGRMTPQFSNGTKVYFGSKEVREKVYPKDSDGAAYGSLVFTPCQNFKELKNLRILIIDDTTGENGGIIPPEQALKLVGDCYGRMNPNVAEKLTGMTNTPFQFRMGIKPQTEASTTLGFSPERSRRANNDVHRIAKGTLAPSVKLESLGQPQIIRSGRKTVLKMGYNLVLPTSSFKGRKDSSRIQPGEYNFTVGIGVKTPARYGKHSLGTQVLVNYPKGVEADILPKLEEKATLLAELQSDPRKIANYFVEKHKLQHFDKTQCPLELQSGVPSQAENLTVSESPHFGPSTSSGQAAQCPPDISKVGSIFDELLKENEEQEETESNEQPEPSSSQDNQLIQVLEACIEHHPQLLEHEKIVDKLRSLVRKEWHDISTGRAIEFQSGLAQPSLDLRYDEICVPYLPEGEKLIVTRSPLVNSNGVITLTNRHLPEFRYEKGTVHIHPETAATYLQADFDGDRLAYELASKYPTLAAEIEEKQRPENRHADVVKAAKEEYVANSFAEIAIAASSNKIGLIANDIQKAVAIYNEVDNLPEHEQKVFLVGTGIACKRISSFDLDALNIHDSKRRACEAIQQKAVSFPDQTPIEQLQTAKKLFFETVNVLSNELQTAVDGAKSAARPNEDILNFASTLLNARDVAWIKDKKQADVYQTRLMKSENYSPIDRMIQVANNKWQENHLESLPTHQFAHFFEKNYTPATENKAKEIVQTYNQLYKEAIALKEQAKNEPGYQLLVISATSGKQITLTNLLKYNHPSVWSSQSIAERGAVAHMDLKLITKSNQLVAIAQTPGENPRWQIVGNVSRSSITEHNLKPGMTLKGAKVELIPGITTLAVKAKFKEAQAFVEKVRTSTQLSDCSEHAADAHSMQSAIWHVAHASKQKGYANYSKASAAFNIFPEQVAERVKEFQFKELTLAGVHQPTNEWGGQLNHKTVEFEVALETRKNHPNFNKRVILVEGKQVAPLSEQSYQLPIGTKGKATLTPAPSTSCTATTAKG